MSWYLMDVGTPINGCQIKQRYGKEFEADKRHQNIPRYVIYSVDGRFAGAERHTLRSAKKWCKKHNEKNNS